MALVVITEQHLELLNSTIGAPILIRDVLLDRDLSDLLPEIVLDHWMHSPSGFRRRQEDVTGPRESEVRRRFLGSH